MKDQAIADFELPSTGGKPFRANDQLGQPYVLYFYPKDHTPGCSTEGQDFRDLHALFQALGCAVYGVSRDGLKSHASFKAKLGLPFELLSDADAAVCERFGVMKQKNLYGKQVRGIERSTFVIGRDGRVAQAWRGVKVPGHAQEVLEFVRTLT